MAKVVGSVLLWALFVAVIAVSLNGQGAEASYGRKRWPSAPPPPPPLSPCATVRCSANYTCCPGAAQPGQGPCVENTAFLFDNRNCGGCGSSCGPPPGRVGIPSICTNSICGPG